MAQERPDVFNFFGPKTLVGPELKPGDKAPEFSLINSKFQEISSRDLLGKPVLISTVPSVDTGVCSLQTHRFDEAAAALGDKVAVVGVSADLPFALGRWCGAENVSTMHVLSDHREMSFANAYGTHVKGLRIESRAVFVVDAEGVVRYAEYVPVAGQHPNYDAALAALRELAG